MTEFQKAPVGGTWSNASFLRRKFQQNQKLRMTSKKLCKVKNTNGHISQNVGLVMQRSQRKQWLKKDRSSFILQVMAQRWADQG